MRDDWTADVDAMAAAVGPDTVLVVGSAPTYPQGVVDPIPAIAELAASVGANCHVDACMGGFVLPFAERLGRDVPPWDFRVEGVHSISADVHKLGYAPKGASVILHRTKELRRYQTFVFDGWLGGLLRLAEPAGHALGGADGGGVGGDAPPRHRRLRRADARARSTPPTACGPASPRSTACACSATARFHCVAMAADGPGVDVFAVGDALAARGWHLDRQTPPDSLHATVSQGNAATMDAYLADLAAAVAAQATTADRSTSYATLE